MDSSVSPKDEICFLRVCHHISTGLYIEGLRYSTNNNLYCTCTGARIHCPEVFVFILNVWEVTFTYEQMFHSYLKSQKNNENFTRNYARSYQQLESNSLKTFRYEKKFWENTADKSACILSFLQFSVTLTVLEILTQMQKKKKREFCRILYALCTFPFYMCVWGLAWKSEGKELNTAYV